MLISKKPRKDSIWTGIFFYVAAVLSMAMSFKLFLEHNYYSGTGWVIISCVLLFVGSLCIYFYNKSKRLTIGSTLDSRRVEEYGIERRYAGDRNKDYELLLSTRDCIKVQFLVDSLRAEGIDIVVLDKHSSRLMSFLPDVEMRLVVPQKDYEKSVKIVEDLLKQE